MILNNLFERFNTIDFYLSLVIAVIVFLLLFSLVFATYTVLQRIRNNLNERRRLLLEKKWQPIILGIIAGNLPSLIPLRSINKRDEFFFVEYVMRYALVLKGEEREGVTKLAYPFLNRLIEDSKQANPETRAYTIKILSVIRFEEYLNGIIAALDDPSPLVAMVAAHALAKKEHPRYIGAILKRLDRFENWSIGYISSMIAAAGPEIAPALRKTYADPGMSSRVRSIAAETLLMIKDYASADIAANLLESEKDRDLLATSLRLLKAFGQAKHLPQLRKISGTSDSVVRAQSLSALGSIGDRSDFERLYDALSDSSTWVVLHAARGLARAGGIDRLKEVASSELPQAEIAREVLLEVENQ